MHSEKLEKAIGLFETFLYFDLERTEFTPLIVNHPIIESAFLVDKDGLFNATEDEGRLGKYRSSLMEHIRKGTDSIEGLIYHVRKPYRLAFLKYLLQDKILSPKEVANLLGKIWTTLENINYDVNVKKSVLLSWIKKTDKEVLMNEDERAVFDGFSEELTIYRGSSDKKGHEGLCWTLDKGMAEWFAKRFHGAGYVFEATVKKDDIIAYLNNRNEKELIVDYKKLTEVKKFEVS